MSQHFNILVIGDNSQDIVKNYDINKEMPKRVLYEYNKRETYQKNAIKTLESLIEEAKKNIQKDNKYEYFIDQWKGKLEYIKSLSSVDYYVDLCENYEVDEDNGDIYTTKNIEGKYESCNLGKNFALPFKNKDGKEVYQAKKKDIDWSLIHGYNTEVYKRVWEMVLEGSEPQNEEEQKLYNNMHDKKLYFSNFSSKEEYIKFNTNFWCYAFVDENKWIDLDDEKCDQFTWVNNFYDRFIEPLSDDTMLSIYECWKNN